MHSNYYEAIIQLRPSKKPLEEFVEEFVVGSGKAKISKKKRVTNGLDFYITSWKVGVTLGHTLARRFGGRAEISRKLYGRSRKKGSIVYRCTVLYRGPRFDKGEIIAKDGKLFRVTSIGKGKVVVGENLEIWKKETLKPDETWTTLEKKYVPVSRTLPKLEILNPEDYQGMIVANPKPVSSSKVEVVIYLGKAYLVH